MSTGHEAKHGRNVAVTDPATQPSPPVGIATRPASRRPAVSTVIGVLVLLPPSETKRDGGDGRRCGSTRCAHPELEPAAQAAASTSSSRWPATSRPAGPRWACPSGRTARSRATPRCGPSPTAAGAAPLHRGALRRARRRSLSGAPRRPGPAPGWPSARRCSGCCTADDPVPAYRLSAGSALPGPAARSPRVWRPVLEPVLAAIAARRAGGRPALAGPTQRWPGCPGAVTVTVLAERADGSRTVVSHFNKAHKGRLAGCWPARARSRPTPPAVATLARRAGMRVERPRPLELEIIVPA